MPFSNFANTLPQLQDLRWTIWLLQINGIVIKDITAYHKKNAETFVKHKVCFEKLRCPHTQNSF